jgi:hypothetical protein
MASLRLKKTNPIILYCVLSAAFCGKEIEKTKPIISCCVLRTACCEKSLKKQSQLAKHLSWSQVLAQQGVM